MIPKNLLPGGMRYCVAGGWAACPAMAGDQDVWVFPQDAKVEDIRQEILDHLDKSGFSFQEEDNSTSEYYMDNVLKTAKVFFPTRRPIQIMVAMCGTPQDLLSGFDISTHAVAITDEGEVVRHPKWTSLFEKPKALAGHNERTPDRLRKIVNRYTTHKGVQFLEASDIPF